MSPSQDELSCLDEAAAWVVRAQAGLSKTEQAALKAWLAASPEHAAAMDLATRAWSGLGEVAAKPAPAPARAVRRRIEPSPWLWAGGALAAAAVAGLAVLGVMPMEKAYRTGPGDSRVVALADGSQIRLAGDTELRVRDGLFSRAAVLGRGQAEFDIVHDARRPFRVRARQVEVRDLGTRFVVRDRGDAEYVRLLEGRVLLADPTSGRALRELQPGQEAQLSASSGGLAVAVATPAHVAMRSGGRMLLRDTSLFDTLRTIEWQNGVDIVLRDRELGNIRISGSYQTDNAASFLNALAQVEPVRWRVTGPNKFEVSRRQ